MTDVHSTSWKA